MTDRRTLLAAAAGVAVGGLAATAITLAAVAPDQSVSLQPGQAAVIGCASGGVPSPAPVSSGLRAVCPTSSLSPSGSVSPAVSPTSTVVAGKPPRDGTNTGYAGTGTGLAQLTNAHIGSYTITAPGAYSLLNVSGELDVKASNVTVTRSKVGCGIYGVKVWPGYTGVTIADTTVVGTGSTCSAGLVLGTDTVAQRIDISGSADGVKTIGVGHPQLLDSFIHNLAVGSTTHNDGVQLSSGSLTVARCSIIGNWRQQTSAIIVKPDFGDISSITVDSNWLSGGTYSLYLLDVVKHDASGNVTARYYTKSANVTNNTFDVGSPLYGYTDVRLTTPAFSAGNRTAAGATVGGLS